MKSNLFLALAFALTTIFSVRAENKIPDEYKSGGFFTGCQAWTFRKFTLFEAIEKTAACGGTVIEFMTGQKLSPEQPDVVWGPQASPEIIQKVKDKLAACHVHAVSYGVVEIPKDEAAARPLFEWAKTMGLRSITTESVESINTIEKMVKEFDIMVGFHDHPKNPNNPKYHMWDPRFILSVVKDRDPRIGACADTGHWVRSGLDPVDCLRILKGRIISSHLKDLNEKSPEAHDVPFGTGVSNIGGILDELHKQHFDGNLSIEYEYDWDTSMPEVAQCVGFVRGYGEAKKW